MSNKTLIIESCEKIIESDFSNTSIVHVRNSVILKEMLGADLLSHASQIDSLMDNNYDSIICVYASPYMKYKAYMRIVENNIGAKLFWMVNDHDLEDNILLRNVVKEQGRKYNVVCNNPRSGYRHWILGKKMCGKKLDDWIDEWHTVNLNCLIYRPSKETETLLTTNRSGCIYFGTFRKWRAEDMIHFNGLNYIISTSKKNTNKYINAGVEAQFVDRLSWEVGAESLRNFKYSIYFEDKHTHGNYAFMGNRYYECVMCDVLMLFDSKCLNTIKKSGYDIPKELVVDNGEQANHVMDSMDKDDGYYNYLLDKQRENYKEIIKNKIKTSNYLKSLFHGQPV